MQHYLQTKEEYKDCILFYRLGDFYEMFFEDAKTVSKELELTLTGKSCGLEERAPMCGVPFHAADGYINRLVKKGYKVAICEQVEDPKLAKGIVKREVIRVVTPGTNIDMQSLDEAKNNYLMCIVYIGDKYGIATTAARMAHIVLHDEKAIMPASAELCGEYGESGLFAGVPCVLGANGVEQIVELALTAEEQAQFHVCCDGIRANMKHWKDIRNI